MSAIIYIYMMLCLAFFTRIFYIFLPQKEIFYFVLLIGIMLFGLILVVIGHKNIYKYNKIEFIIYLILPVLISAMYSFDYKYTIYFATLLIISIGAGIITGVYIKYPVFVKSVTIFVRTCCFISACLSIIGIGYDVSDGISDRRLGFYGIFGHKSAAGLLFALSASLEIACLRNKPKKSATAFIFLSIAVYDLYLSDSRTGIVVLLVNGIFIVAAEAFQAINIKTEKALSLMTFSLAIFAFFIFLWAIVLWNGVSGNEGINTTGRTELWRYLVSAVIDNFPAGYGYATFFADPKHTPFKYYMPPHAHNTMLQMLLELGIFALLPFYLATKVFYRIAKFAAYKVTKSADYVALFCFILCIISAAVDFSIFSNSSFANYFFVVLAVYSARHAIATSVRPSLTEGVRKDSEGV